MVSWINLVNFRNLNVDGLGLAPGLNLIVGENGQGKSNFLEAIYYLGTGRSWRDTRDAHLVRWEADFLRVEGQSQHHRLAVAYQVAPPHKFLWVNGISQRQLEALLGCLPVVIFTPGDLQIVKGNPEGRRRFIDQMLGQVQRGYINHWMNYQRVLRQRNRLLGQIRQRHSAVRQLEPWDVQLVQEGSYLLQSRLISLQQVAEITDYYYSLLISQPCRKLRLAYSSDVVPVEFGPAELPDLSRINESFWHTLQKKKDQEIARGITLVGPQRDDLLFCLEGREMRFFASQGQQRLLAFALRLAVREILRTSQGQEPILLLDDIFSELDATGRQRVATAIGRGGQIFLSTPEPASLPGAMLTADSDSVRLRVKDGHIII